MLGRKKSFNSIMRGFITAKEDLGVYIKDQEAEEAVQQAKAQAAVDAANLAVDNIKAASRTIKQLEKIVG